MPDNIKGLLCWLLGIIGGIIFLVVEKENEFVRLHAAQSVVASVIFIILQIISGYISIPFSGAILTLLPLLIMIVGIVKAYNKESYKFPLIGDLAESLILKSNTK